MNDEDPKPKKGRKSSKKVITPIDSEFLHTKEDIRDLIGDLLKVKIAESKEIKKVEDINNALVSTIGEFLNSFMLIGYDNEGKPIAIIKSNSNMEADALHTLLTKFFTLQMIKFNQKYGGEDF
jgi:hypothetical protein